MSGTYPDGTVPAAPGDFDSGDFGDVPFGGPPPASGGHGRLPAPPVGRRRAAVPAGAIRRAATSPAGPFLFEAELIGFLKAAGFPSTPLNRPRNVPLPAITTTFLDREQPRTLLDLADMIADEFRITCWGNDYPAALATATAIRRLLAGYRGPIGVVDVLLVSAYPTNSLVDAPDDGAHPTYRVPADYRFAYRPWAPPAAVPPPSVPAVPPPIWPIARPSPAAPAGEGIATYFAPGYYAPAYFGGLGGQPRPGSPPA